MVHRNFDDYTKLDQRLQWKLQKEWDELQDDYESRDKEICDHQHENTMEEPLETNDEDDDDYTNGLEDYLIFNQEYNFVNEKAEAFKKQKCQHCRTVEGGEYGFFGFFLDV